MSASKKIKMAMVNKGMSLNELAAKLEQTPQNLTNKFRRNNLSEKDASQMADALGYDVKIVLVDRETGEEI